MVISTEYLIAVLFTMVVIGIPLIIWFNPWDVVWKILRITPINEQDC